MKFRHPALTAKGDRRASVSLERLETLWFNTGTLCNIACVNCYIESSPSNGRLAYLRLEDAIFYLDEIEHRMLGTRLIGFTGGEPFMNPYFMAILAATLDRGFEVLVLTNAMKPLEHKREALVALSRRHRNRLRIRISLDDWNEAVHDKERGDGSFAKTMEQLLWLHSHDVPFEIAGRFLSGASPAASKAGYASLFAAHGIPIDCEDPLQLVLLPEMNAVDDPPEISEACWDILGKSPGDVMCSNSRMVVRRAEADAPAVLACTLLPYASRFELGATLAEASGPVPLAHPYCASFVF